MSNPNFFSDDDIEEIILCPTCSFNLSEHSVKQILNCARKEISLVLGVENK